MINQTTSSYTGCYKQTWPTSDCEANRCPQLQDCKDHQIDHLVQKQYYTQKWANFRRKIIKNSDGKCKRCPAKINLQVHHILRVKLHPHLFYEKENCAVLCKKCHESEHAERLEAYDRYLEFESRDPDEEVLCESCGVNYHLGKYRVCYECFDMGYMFYAVMRVSTERVNVFQVLTKAPKTPFYKTLPPATCAIDYVKSLI